MRSTLFACFVLLFIGCGGGGKSGGGDDVVDIDAPAVSIDAPPAGPNPLGQLCPTAAGGGGTACPAGASCVTITGVGTNTTTGYCTPNCMAMNAICTTGYTGPAGGMPQCALSPAAGQPANGCAIVCTAGAQCGTGLSCIPVPGQAVMVCVPT